MKWRTLLQEYGVWIALGLLVLVSIASPNSNFLNPENLRNMLSQNAHIGIIAIGMTLVIMTGGIDLSVGSLVAFAGAVAILSLNRFGGEAAGMGIALALAASVGTGLLAGMLNGVIVAYGRVAPFIVTLAGLAAYRSLAQVLGDGGEIRSAVPEFGRFGFEGIPIPFLRTAGGAPVTLYWSAVLFLLVALVAAAMLKRTRFGRYVVAVGANERAAQYSAIDTAKVKVAVYGILGLLVGLATFVNAARMNSVGTSSVGLYYELDAIAATVIGGTSLRGGMGRIWGTVGGVILLTVLTNLQTIYKIDTDWQGVVRGLVILVAVLLQRGSRTSG